MTRRGFGSVKGRLLAVTIVVGGVTAIALGFKDIKRYLKLRSM